MNKIKCILFDCMETLIDMTQLPTLKDYALWAYSGSDVENHWNDFDDFFKYYIKAKEKLHNSLPSNKEYDLIERFQIIASMKLNNTDLEKTNQIANKLMDNYWKNYSERCYVKEDVSYALSVLSKNYKLGVVSNFMVKNGIEELLERNNIIHYFDNITTSVNNGWRKPHDNIYSEALDFFSLQPNEIIFVGDDYINDYEKTTELGFNAIFLDRYNKYEEVPTRVCDFYELVNKIIK